MAEQLARPRSRRLAGVRYWILLIGGIFAFAEAFKVITAPWAVGWLPGPKLPGTYVGALRAKLGSEHRVFLDLRYADRAESTPNIEGTGRVCGQDGTVYDYEVDGRADRDGGNLTLDLIYPDPKLSALGLRFTGAWRGDVMPVSPGHNPFMPDGTFLLNRTVSSTDPDNSFLPTELRKASLDDFEAGCRQLRA